MARVGHEIRPELLGLPECKLAMQAAHTVFKARGQGPTTPATSIQHVALLREDGKATEEDVRMVAGLFDLFDETKPAAEDFEPQAVEVVRKRLRHAIAQAAVAEHNTERWDDMRELLKREEALGQGEGGIGIVTTAENVFAAMERLRLMKRLPFGITGLDEAFNGGAPRGTLTCFMAGPGGAKSMTMSHIAGQLAMSGLLCAYATLEIPSEQVISRIVANQTGATIDEVLSGVANTDIAARYAAFKPVPPIVQDFEPHITTVDVITEWVGQILKHGGRPVDVLLVDYADKLTANGKVDDKNSYQEMRVVYEKLRIYCKEVGILGITASQSRARDEKKKGGAVIDLEHVADSMHKARVVDQFVTLNFDDDSKEMTFFLAKNRYGEGRKKVGPLPTNFACGQVAPVVRPELPKIITHHHSISPIASVAKAFETAETAVRLGADPAQVWEQICEREPGSDG